MPDGNTLTITRVLPASRSRVFAAWTNADLLKQWFAPSETMTTPVSEADARPGGDYRIVMENADGETHTASGTYEQVIPDEKLVFSWQWANSELVTRVTIVLRELGDNQTELTLTHDGFPETDIRDRHNEGWTGCLDRLATYFQ